jgi:hypothetical protein
MVDLGGTNYTGLLSAGDISLAGRGNVHVGIWVFRFSVSIACRQMIYLHLRRIPYLDQLLTLGASRNVMGNTAFGGEERTP